MLHLGFTKHLRGRKSKQNVRSDQSPAQSIAPSEGRPGDTFVPSTGAADSTTVGINLDPLAGLIDLPSGELPAHLLGDQLPPTMTQISTADQSLHLPADRLGTGLTDNVAPEESSRGCPVTKDPLSQENDLIEPTNIPDQPPAAVAGHNARMAIFMASRVAAAPMKVPMPASTTSARLAVAAQGQSQDTVPPQVRLMNSRMSIIAGAHKESGLSAGMAVVQATSTPINQTTSNIAAPISKLAVQVPAPAVSTRPKVPTATPAQSGASAQQIVPLSPKSANVGSPTLVPVSDSQASEASKAIASSTLPWLSLYNEHMQIVLASHKTDTAAKPAGQPTGQPVELPKGTTPIQHDGPPPTNPNTQAAHPSTPKSVSKAAPKPRTQYDPRDGPAWAAEGASGFAPVAKSPCTAPDKKSTLHLAQGDSAPPSEEPDGPNKPTLTDIIRFRQCFGVNLGGVYVLEKWLCGSAFPPNTPAGQTSELSAVALWVKQLGVNGARYKFEQRWASAMGDSDWEWLLGTAHATSIRLPIGYFTLGPTYCKGTPFEPYSGVYANAWTAVKSVISQAKRYGIGVLVDMHALPGGQNTGEHSGTNLNTVNFWDNPSNLELAISCLEFIAKEVKSLDNVVGIQICNEPISNAHDMYGWYSSVFDAISKIDSSMPLYISDAWDLATAIKWAKSKNIATPGGAVPINPVVVDTHLYYCFDIKNKSLSPTAIIQNVPSTLLELIGQTGKVSSTGGCGVVVGEWSVCLDPASWSLFPDGADRTATKKQFGTTQCQHYEANASGAYFWTLKMDWMPGGDWGFMHQINTESVSPPKYVTFTADELRTRLQNVDSKHDDLESKAYLAHINYWDRAAPGQKMNHELFNQGWRIGWNDARAFFNSRTGGGVGAGSAISIPGSTTGGDKIGLKDLWVRKRICEAKGVDAMNVWEFEHGIWQGIESFEKVALA